MKNRLRRLPHLCLVLLLSGPAQSLGCAAQTVLPNDKYVTELFDQGKKLALSGNSEGALIYLDQALQIDPYCLQALWYRGIVQHKLGHLQEAMHDLRQLNLLVPSNSKILEALAATYLFLGINNGALQAGRQAVRLNPSDTVAQDICSVAVMKWDQTADHEEEIERAMGHITNITGIFDNPTLPMFMTGTHGERFTSAQAKAVTGAATVPEAGADQLMARGEWQRASEEYSNILVADPNNILALRNRGIAGMEMRDYKKALLDFNRAIELSPETAELFGLRSGCYIKLGQTGPALASANKALALAPKQPASYTCRADAYMAMQKHDLARADLYEAIKLDPHNVDAYLQLADLERAARQFPQAFENYNRVFALQPNEGRAALGRGICYQNTHQYHEAMADLDLALRVNPGDNDALLARSSVALSLGQNSRVLEDTTHLIAIYPRDGDLYALRARAYVNLKREDNALSDFSMAIKLNPRDFSSRRERMRIYESSGQTQAAFDELRQCQALQPDDKNIGKQWLDALFKSGRYDESVAESTKLLAISPTDPDLLLYRARALLAQTKYTDAANDFSQVLVYRPRDLEALKGRAEAYEKSGNQAQAIRDKVVIEDLQGPRK